MFELTGELIDEIVFCMEDQNGAYVINTRTGAVRVMDNTLPDEEVSLPLWTSAQGFRLMENFTARLKIPPARQRLSAALNQGKGVFRAFKNELSALPEIEKRWLIFKHEELKKAVRIWYEALTEEQGIGKIGAEPEETAELINEDFQFETEAAGAAITITARNAQDADAGAAYAETAYAGKLTAREEAGVFFIDALIIEESFRGLGLGTALLERFLPHAQGKPVVIDLPAESEAFSKTLLREGFTVTTSRYRREGR